MFNLPLILSAAIFGTGLLAGPADVYAQPTPTAQRPTPTLKGGARHDVGPPASSDPKTDSADTFGTSDGLPGEPRIGQYGRDPECGGTNRRYYDEMYGTNAVVISVPQMNQLYVQGRIIRCGACGQNTVICWLKSSAAAGRPPSPVPTETPSPPMRPGVTPAGPNVGKVCPNARSPQEAAAAGCRWIGSNKGYDLCANPNWYTLPQCVAGSQPAPGQGSKAAGGQTDCAPTPDASVQNQLHGEAHGILREFVGMGEQADIFLKTLGKLIAVHFTQLARPNTTNQDIARAAKFVVDYVSNDDVRSETHGHLWADAKNAVEFASHNGAAALAMIADQILMGRAVGAGVSGCTATVARLEKLSKNIMQARKAEERIGNVRRNLVGASQNGLCPVNKQWTPVNPFAGQQNCAAVAVAQAKRWRTGKPYTDSDIRISGDDLMSRQEFWQILRDNFGGQPIKDLPYYRQVLQDLGRPYAITRKKLEDELRNAGKGSQGIVLLRGAGGIDSNGMPLDHVVNVRNSSSGILYWDAQKGIRAEFMVDRWGPDLMLYRVP